MMMKISYYGSKQHLDGNGVLRHGPGCNTCLPMHTVEPGISDACKNLVKERLLQNPKATHVEVLQGKHLKVDVLDA